ncbi:tRNA (N6-threonylcarbamoyladenosine(37)-N6)-methyltransferase TrmO [Candidatus Cloacimonadota bacterium]
MKLEIESIGIIHTPFTDLKNMPIQPAGAEGIKGTIEIFEPFVPGLKDLDGFSHIILLFYFHKSTEYKMQVVPYMDTEIRGLFATRAPRRPSQIGLSVVQLDKIEGNRLLIQNVDMLDGTPLLDIKPYYPEFDLNQSFRSGWLENRGKNVVQKRSDERFVE